MKSKQFQVLKDSREQCGWDFPAAGDCLGTVVEALPTGDYTLRGYETIFVIERKRSMGELAANLTDKRFHRELERLDSFPLPFLVCEFDFSDILRFPEGSGIPKSKWGRLRVTPRFLLSCVNQIMVKHKTKIIFAGAHGQEEASSLFKRVVENNVPS